MTYRVAHSLNVLLAEINTVWPDRSKASDGAKGDDAHAKRQSDHNPNAQGVVQARDYDVTSISKDEAQKLADWIVDRLVRRGQGGYVIYNRRIANPDIHGGSWRDYDGPNPHVKHIHVSVHSCIDTSDPWGVIPAFEFEEGIDPMITTTDIAKAVWSATTGRDERVAAMSTRVARAERDAAATLAIVRVIASTVGVTAEQVEQILKDVTADNTGDAA